MINEVYFVAVNKPIIIQIISYCSYSEGVISETFTCIYRKANLLITWI